LFGVFKNSESRSVIDRFYYLADWVDEYCDLTLDKMITETERVGKRNIAHTINTPEDLEAFKEQMNMYNKKSSISTTHLVIDSTIAQPSKKHFFDKVKSIFKKS
jgi:transcriptional regulator of NAD metabolism